MSPTYNTDENKEFSSTIKTIHNNCTDYLHTHKSKNNNIQLTLPFTTCKFEMSSLWPALWHLVKLLLSTPVSHLNAIWAPMGAQLLQFWSISLITHLREQCKRAQVLVDYMEDPERTLASTFSLDNRDVMIIVGVTQQFKDLSLSPHLLSFYLCLSVCNFAL